MAKSKTSLTTKVAVKRCARCGGDHPALTFKRLQRPAKDFGWWARCPETGEPVLMQILPAPEGVKAP